MTRRSLRLTVCLLSLAALGPEAQAAGETAFPSSAERGSPQLAEAAHLLANNDLVGARKAVDQASQAGAGGPERTFLDGLISFASKDYRRAEAMFRQLLDENPHLLRVRLELARTLYMEKKDEQADYHFRMAAGEHPPASVSRNIIRFREALRARRSWRFNMNFGFAPDSNINSATDKESVDIYGLPFQLDPSARARSGIGRFAGGDASIRLNRDGRMPIYVGAFGRWTTYSDHRFDDAHAGLEAGPELNLAGGQFRATATGLMRWYGRRPLVKSMGVHLEYERIVGDAWTLGGSLLVRRNDYAGRKDVDGLDVETRLSASRPLGPTMLGFGYAAIQRNSARDTGQAFWRQQLGLGVLKEIGWGLRPQLSITLARQVGDGLLAPFGKQRKDVLLEASVSIYKRDWNFQGLAPSVSLTFTRNKSTIALYDEKRRRAEIRLTKAF